MSVSQSAMNASCPAAEWRGPGVARSLDWAWSAAGQPFLRPSPLCEYILHLPTMYILT